MVDGAYTTRWTAQSSRQSQSWLQIARRCLREYNDTTWSADVTVLGGLAEFEGELVLARKRRQGACEGQGREVRPSAVL
jgi:hypothetical protein